MAAQEDTLKSEELTGAEKAAVLVLTLNEDVAAEILKSFSHKEVQLLTSIGARLTNVDEKLIIEIREEFIRAVLGGVTGTLGGGQSRGRIRSILSRFLDSEQVDKYMEEMVYGEDLSQGFEAIRHIDAKTIATFVMDEHPQTVALIMAHLDVGKAAQVLPLLPPDRRADVIMRIASLDRISPAIVKNIMDVFVHEIIASGAGKSRQVGGSESVAQLMNNLDGSMVQSIFTELEQANPSFCEEIRGLMFVFTDLISLDDRSLQQIIKEVTNDVLTLALKTAPTEMREKIFKNISSRAAEMIKEELTVMGPVKLSDVEKAQSEIVAIARRLEEEGKITVVGKGGAEELV